MRTRIKFCGITSVQDALAAARAGADAIGMVFYPGARRCISLEVARQIVRQMPPFVTQVGLFVDADVAEIRRTAETLGLRHVQLHGHEPVEAVSALRGLSVLKAVQVDDMLANELAKWKDAISSPGLDHLRGLVLETSGAGVGGTGIENNWAAVQQLQRRGAFDGLPPLIAAGGLRPQNVARVIYDIRPWAVDVSSGIEDAPGRKSVERMEAFVNAAAGDIP